MTHDLFPAVVGPFTHSGPSGQGTQEITAGGGRLCATRSQALLNGQQYKRRLAHAGVCSCARCASAIPPLQLGRSDVGGERWRSGLAPAHPGGAWIQVHALSAVPELVALNQANQENVTAAVSVQPRDSFTGILSCALPCACREEYML